VPTCDPPYERWTKDALYHRAKEDGVAVNLHMNKFDLIEAMRASGSEFDS
jgi:hypothetical protein